MLPTLHQTLHDRILGKSVLLLGVGNRMRCDDGVGSYLAERLDGLLPIPVIDGEDVPENYLGLIEALAPDLVLVLDAVEMQATPGELAILDLDQLKAKGFSTHSGGLTMIFEAMPEGIRPETLFVGIQPGIIGFGQGLSEAVDSTMESLESILIQLFSGWDLSA